LSQDGVEAHALRVPEEAARSFRGAEELEGVVLLGEPYRILGGELGREQRKRHERPAALVEAERDLLEPPEPDGPHSGLLSNLAQGRLGRGLEQLDLAGHGLPDSGQLPAGPAAQSQELHPGAASAEDVNLDLV